MLLSRETTIVCLVSLWGKYMFVFILALDDKLIIWVDLLERYGGRIGWEKQWKVSLKDN